VTDRLAWADNSVWKLAPSLTGWSFLFLYRIISSFTPGITSEGSSESLNESEKGSFLLERFYHVVWAARNVLAIRSFV